jgi:hypothetical protein
MVKASVRALRIFFGLCLLLVALIAFGVALLFGLGQILIPAAPVSTFAGVLGFDIAGGLGITALFGFIGLVCFWLGLRCMRRSKMAALAPETPTKESEPNGS